MSINRLSSEQLRYINRLSSKQLRYINRLSSKQLRYINRLSSKQLRCHPEGAFAESPDRAEMMLATEGSVLSSAPSPARRQRSMRTSGLRRRGGYRSFGRPGFRSDERSARSASG
jgi:hypothetical protein